MGSRIRVLKYFIWIICNSGRYRITLEFLKSKMYKSDHYTSTCNKVTSLVKILCRGTVELGRKLPPPYSGPECSQQTKSDLAILAAVGPIFSNLSPSIRPITHTRLELDPHHIVDSQRRETTSQQQCKAGYDKKGETPTYIWIWTIGSP